MSIICELSNFNNNRFVVLHNNNKSIVTEIDKTSISMHSNFNNNRFVVLQQKSIKHLTNF